MADFDLDSACRVFQRFTGAKPFGTVGIDGRIVARLFKDHDRHESCVRIARNYHRSFSLHFPNVPHKGCGQTVNLEKIPDITIDISDPSDMPELTGSTLSKRSRKIRKVRRERKR